jgi:hypothetical protein
MLESLDSIPTDQLVEALYFGARLITHRKDLNGRGVGPYERKMRNSGAASSKPWFAGRGSPWRSLPMQPHRVASLHSSP